MNRTIQYLQADLARAQQQGAKTLDISTADLVELLRLAERGASEEPLLKAKKRGGWVSPSAMHALLTGKVKIIRIHRRRSDQCNMQVFYGDNLEQKRAEALAAQEVAP